ncbi:MAG: phosphoglycerate kinase [Candidatus Kerfeldbacteria bacterium]|nr:phosphoglycerate kinase [Candidatus Kerfeldbacteria bacterium]
MKLPRLSSLRVAGARVLVRVGVDVPTDDRGRVRETFRLERALPTIQWLQRHRARILLCGHRGRPRGRRSRALSLKPVRTTLARMLKTPIGFSELPARRLVSVAAGVRPGGILLLENLRFDRREEVESPAFAKELAALADAYVNDDFSTSHRAHTSLTVLPRLLPHAAGLTLMTEVVMLERLLRAPRRPFVVVLGGAKVADKLSALRHLLPRVDAVLVGGAAANTLLRAHGVQIGWSLRDSTVTKKRLAPILTSKKVHLPVDVVAAPGADRGRASSVSVHDFPSTLAAFDIGPVTARRYAGMLRTARTVFWAGPLGVTESPRFRAGSRVVLRGINRRRSFAVAGGGDTIFALRLLKQMNRFSYCSTGGGATLDYLGGARLPALNALLQ